MKYSTYLIHYNHRHDKLGRFASAVGGSSDSIIRKNKKYTRISGTKNEDDKNPLTYASSSRIDRKIYISETGSIFGDPDSRYMYKFKTTENIKVAGRQTQAKSFAKILKDADIKDLVKHTEHLDGNVNPKLKGYVKDSDLARLYKKARKDQDAFYMAFDAFIQNIDNRGKLTKRFIKDLKSQGYGALTDEYDVGHGKAGKINYYDSKGHSITGTAINANSATIFLERNKHLKTVKVKDIKDSDIKWAEIWLRANGYVKDVEEEYE